MFLCALTAGRVRPAVIRLERLADWLRQAMGTRIARLLVLSLFVAQATVLVFAMHTGTPPDETNHIQFIEFYAKHSLSPIFSHQTPTYFLGDKTREPDYLYHYVMSLVYRVVPLATADKYLAIRLCSVGLALLTMVILAKVLKRLGLSAATITTCLLILTNLPMVLMMSAAVNNDVPVWLGTVLGMWLVLRLWQRPDLYDFLWLIVLALLGGLVKRTLMPLVLVFALMGAAVVLRNYRKVWLQFRHFDWRLIAIGALIILSSGLFLERVGGNLIRYHTITPSCNQVQGVLACSVFWGNIRTDQLSDQPAQALLPAPIFAIYWVSFSSYNVIDIQTQYWLHEVEPPIFLVVLLTMLFAIGLAYGIWQTWRKRQQLTTMQRWQFYVLLVGIYFLLVHLVYNYSTYLQLQSFGLALNGRYIIPGVLLLTGLSCFFWVQWLHNRPRLLTAIAALAVVSTIFGSGLGLMLRNTQLYLPTPDAIILSASQTSDSDQN